jgi:hypothetical protein
MVNKKHQVKINAYIKAPITTMGNKFFTNTNIDFLDGLYSDGYCLYNWNDVNSSIIVNTVEKNVKHYRNITFIKESNIFIFFDKMIINPTYRGVDQNYTQVWNLPAYLNNNTTSTINFDKIYFGFKKEQISVNGTDKMFRTTDTIGPNVEFHHFGPNVPTYNLYYGETTPVTYKPQGTKTNNILDIVTDTNLGWSGLGIGSATPAPNVHINWTSGDSNLLFTMIIPINVNTNSKLVSKTNYRNDTEIISTMPTIIHNKIIGFDAIFNDSSTITTRASEYNTVFIIYNLKVKAKMLLYFKSSTNNAFGIIMDCTELFYNGVVKSLPSFDTDLTIITFSIISEKLEYTPIIAAKSKITSSIPPYFSNNLREPDSLSIPKYNTMIWRYATSNPQGRYGDLEYKAFISPNLTGYSNHVSIHNCPTQIKNQVNKLNPTGPLIPALNDVVIFVGTLKINVSGVYVFRFNYGLNSGEFKIGNFDDFISFPSHCKNSYAGQFGAESLLNEPIGLKEGYHNFYMGYQNPNYFKNKAFLTVEGPDNYLDVSFNQILKMEGQIEVINPNIR